MFLGRLKSNTPLTSLLKASTRKPLSHKSFVERSTSFYLLLANEHPRRVPHITQNGSQENQQGTGRPRPVSPAI
jgi:hypothetical protein